MQSVAGTARVANFSIQKFLFLYLFPFIYSTPLDASARPLHQAVKSRILSNSSTTQSKG